MARFFCCFSLEVSKGGSPYEFPGMRTARNRQSPIANRRWPMGGWLMFDVAGPLAIDYWLLAIQTLNPEKENHRCQNIKNSRTYPCGRKEHGFITKCSI